MVRTKRPSDAHDAPASAKHAHWMLDLDTTGLEVQLTPWNALVLLDRTPLAGSSCGMELVQKGLHGLEGSSLTRIGELEQVNDTVVHGIYSGLLGGTAILMDQYVQCINGVPRSIVRVISRANEAPQAGTLDLDRYVLKLMGRP